LPGLVLLAAARATGGVARRRDGVLEACGGALPTILTGLGAGRLSIEAIALGHVILARSVEGLDRFREHEHVHVRQWERWGPVFPFAYVASSWWAWLRGRDAYWANAFEREARKEAPSRTTPASRVTS
jgi:hypothetical protein